MGVMLKIHLPVLEFMQVRLLAGSSPTTLNVYVSAISACHDHINWVSVGQNPLVSCFLHDTTVPPFEPLESASEKFLILKMVLLLAVTSYKRIGYLQTSSVVSFCLDFEPGLVQMILHQRPSYGCKVHPVVLQVFSPSPFNSPEQERLFLPVRALRIYVDHSEVWCKSAQLFIWFESRGMGSPISKQWLSH